MSKDWLSIHIFYYGDQNALLVHGIAPLIEQLRAQGLIQRWFFIKYWVEGFHVRLRLLPAPDADPAQVQQLAEASIAHYLQAHPAFYQFDDQHAFIEGREFFVVEYGQKKWDELYGETGFMPLRPNNTFVSWPYEREYERYGGSEEALELAEWHFEHSSDTVISLLRETNTSVSSILLGWSVQLMLAYFYALFENDQDTLTALDLYIANWKRQNPVRIQREDQFAKRYEQMAPALRQRLSKIRTSMLADKPELVAVPLTRLEQTWRNHLVELRQRIADLYRTGNMALPPWAHSSDTFSLHELLLYLQTSYTHMTNNRLGTVISQEVYIAYLLKRTLEDLVKEGNEKEVVLS